MWCFCRKRSSTLEDEQSEEFIRIVCDNSENNATVAQVSNKITSEKFRLSNSHSKNKLENKDGENLNEFTAIYGVHRNKNADYENSEVCTKLVSDGTKEQMSALPSDAESILIPGIGVKLHKADVHSSNRSNFDCNDSKKIQNTADSLETSFSSHCTQTENGILPVPLMKRREKAKSTEMTENPHPARVSNTPLDLSLKPTLKDVSHVINISQKSKGCSIPLSKTYHYENLPSQSEINNRSSQKDCLTPLDLSIGSSKQAAACSKVLDLHFELYPLNLSKRNLISAETASPSSFGRSCNGELSPMSVGTSNTHCFSTASSRPDLLSNVDNDDYGFSDHSKLSYFNAVYDKSLSMSPQPAHTGQNRVLSPQPHNVKSYNCSSIEAARPVVAHSGSYISQKISSHDRQLQNYQKQNRFNASPQKYLGSSNCLSHGVPAHNAVPHEAHSKKDMSYSSSLHSLSIHSMNNSYYNPSYQNHTLDEESLYAVLDDVQKKPLYDNLEPPCDSVYQIYDDQNKFTNGPTYANMSPKAENEYFAYDNNTYIPPQRLKKKENTYENENADKVDHTYSTISSPNHIASTGSSSVVVPDKTTSTDIYNEVPGQSKDKLSSDQNCSKPQPASSESDNVVALNLVKVPDVPLPVKVKPSSGRNFMKNSKNVNGSSAKKLTNGSNKSGNRFGNKFKGKIKDITLVDASSFSIMDELLSPSHARPLHTPQKSKNKKPSLTSLASHQESTPEKIGPSLEACGKKFSSLSDMKKNCASPTSEANTPKSKGGRRSGRSLLSSFSFRGDKKQTSTPKKSESSRLLSGRNKWSNSSAASLGSIASLASSSSSLSNYIHPPSIASEGGLLSNYRDEYDCASHIYNQVAYSVPPCLLVNFNDSILVENFKLLRECLWYWGALDVKGAEEMLSGKQDGCFLVRDSSDEGCIVSLTFRSLQMTHHTRIEYKNGVLSFHIPVPNSPQIASTSSSSSSPPPSPNRKSNIVAFMARAIEDSVQNCSNLSTNSNSCWLYLERSGPTGTSRVPVKLFTPISKRPNKVKVQTLKWLARKSIVGRVKKESIDALPLSHWLKAYLLIEYISEGPRNMI